MAKTILERMQELLDADISETERFEIQYRIFILEETKRLKTMPLETKDDVKAHFMLLLNLKSVLFMRNERAERDRELKHLIDQVNVVMMQFRNYYPATARDYKRMAELAVKTIENVWYEYRQMKAPVRGL